VHSGRNILARCSSAKAPVAFHSSVRAGALHYLIHAYDVPEHAQQGLKAARAYAQAAARGPPHALHMPSHIFTRLGYWEESAATNLTGWEVSEAGVRRAGESGAFRVIWALATMEPPPASSTAVFFDMSAAGFRACF
jgi:hypothetical protein